MTAQKPFHNFFSRTGGGPLRRVVLVAFVDDDDLLAEVVLFVSVRALRDGLGFAGWHKLILRLDDRGGKRGPAERRCVLHDDIAPPHLQADVIAFLVRRIDSSRRGSQHDGRPAGLQARHRAPFAGVIASAESSTL